VQEDIAGSIVRAVRAEVVADSPPRRSQRRPSSFGAYQLYLRGRAASNQRTDAKIREAAALFEEAIAADPDYADAHGALAHARILLWEYVSTETRDGPLLAQAEASARRAIELDPESAVAHASFANVRAVRYLDWSGAEAAYQRALELNPGLVSVRRPYSSMLMQIGRLDDSRVQLLKALELDPLSPVVNRNVGRNYLYAGDHQRALEFLWRGLELNPDDPLAPSLLMITYTQMGREDEALDAIASLAPAPTRPFLRGSGRLLGNRATAAALVQVVRLYSECPIRANVAAQIYAYIDWPDAMFHCLDQSFHSDLGYIALNPRFDSHRSDPRFRELLARAGLDAPRR
jgi:Tfp pilus assembly protein PilF